MKTTVEISGNATYTLGKLADSLTQRRPLNAALGKRGEVELREHFLQRNQEPNKKGWPAQNFWERIRTSTALLSADESGATVVIADPAFAGKTHDHTVTPKEGKYLALPAIAEAYGRSPRTFSNLEPVIRWRDGKRRAVALAERQATQISYGGKRKDGSRAVKGGREVGSTVFYWLVESVRMKRDPRALPERAKMEAALREEAGFFLAEFAR